MQKNLIHTKPTIAGEKTNGKASAKFIKELRADILDHLKSLQLPALKDGKYETLSKDSIRASHAPQRSDIFDLQYKALAPYWEKLIENFANGNEINPSTIDPELVLVSSDDETGYLFRFASLLWSVPVSHGYGRRMRFLVRDRSNGKLIGIFALGDPVFNLHARDKWIGWDVNDRRARLVNVMDAYVVGAVPPYSQLLGGKLVASLIGSKEVSKTFSARYGKTKGIISGEEKSAHLSLVTITSALGHSSLYNRLKLYSKTPDMEDQPLVELIKIGETVGYGHFHLSNSIFERIRTMLELENHPYANSHKFGQGPNWRWRVIRVGLKRVGLDEELLRHGIAREIYAMPLAENFQEYLRGEVKKASLHRPSANDIAQAAIERWVLPRSNRKPEYKSWRREEIMELIQSHIPDSKLENEKMKYEEE